MSSCKLCDGSGWFYPEDDGDLPEPCDYCNYEDLDQWQVHETLHQFLLEDEQ